MLDKLRLEMEHLIQRMRLGQRASLRFIILTTDGEYLIVINPDVEAETYNTHINQIQRFMIWKNATRFIVSSKITATNALTAIAVWRDSASGERKSRGIYKSISLDNEQKLYFQSEQDLDEGIPSDILNMLPKENACLWEDEITNLSLYVNNQENFIIKKIK